MGCSGLFLWTIAAIGAADRPDFEREVAPVLIARCVECHNPADRSGGLDLTTKAGLEAGGENGPVVDRDDPAEGTLVRKILGGEMPPKKAGKPRPFAGSESAALATWARTGAAWPESRTLDLFEKTSATRAGRDWWSLQPVVRPEIPRVEAATPANPIDAFILEGLAAKGWTLAPRAGRRALIRRIYQDTVGLPPSYDVAKAFEADDRPDAYARLVDRLLASPRFGERQARHWLDVARFAETSGYERDQEKPFAWRYRDWVIKAINDDLPLDRFVTEQIAGDEIADRTESTVIATGFLRLGTWNDEPNDPNEYQYERLEDLVHATSTAFLALTVKCARCHDHKFDPIRQSDYYRMAAPFWAGYVGPGPREWLGGPPSDALGRDLLGWTDRGREVPKLHLLKKGDPTRPGPAIEPTHLSILPTLERPYDPPSPGARTTGRRLQLARWIVDRRNPLTTRVAVNRTWAEHLGAGLVRTPDNFGFNGEKPTHPKLLDWLASELAERGGRSKPIHRLILMSETYRQASIHPEASRYARTDAGNRLWWHAERRRLDAESLRDALLSASGRLDGSRIGGPSFHDEVPPDALEGLSTRERAWTASPPGERLRRGLYSYTKRGLLPPFLTTFDLPDTTLPCARRDVTLVAPQALALLNNRLVHDQSTALGTVIARMPPSAEARIVAAWRAVLGRDPDPAEVAMAREHLDARSRQGSAESAIVSLCHVLMNANEFLYLD